jgi:hypothetical protein
MNFEEKIAATDKRRLAGNELFKSGDLTRAVGKHLILFRVPT